MADHPPGRESAKPPELKRQTVKNNSTPTSSLKVATPAGNVITFFNVGPTPFQTAAVGATMFAHGEFHQIEHSLLALMVEMIGGFLARLAGRDDRERRFEAE